MPIPPYQANYPRFQLALDRLLPNLQTHVLEVASLRIQAATICTAGLPPAGTASRRPANELPAGWTVRAPPSALPTLAGSSHEPLRGSPLAPRSRSTPTLHKPAPVEPLAAADGELHVERPAAPPTAPVEPPACPSTCRAPSARRASVASARASALPAHLQPNPAGSSSELQPGSPLAQRSGGEANSSSSLQPLGVSAPRAAPPDARPSSSGLPAASGARSQSSIALDADTHLPGELPTHPAGSRPLAAQPKAPCARDCDSAYPGRNHMR